jgi:hypothetical protein
VASFDKAVPPGQEGKITLSVKTDNMSGKFNKSATIPSNDPKNPTMRIKLSGEIKQYIGITPSSRLYLTGFEGEVITKSVTITNNQDTPLKITKVTSDIDDKIDYELKTLVKEKEYELTVKNGKDLQGISRGTITLTTNSEKKPTLEIKVSINLRGELVVSPTAIYFGNINLTSKEEKAPPLTLTKYVTVTKEKGDPIKIKKVTSSSNLIQTKVETKEEGKRFTITVSLDKDKLKEGSTINENIEIQTNYKKNPKVKVAVKGTVK